MISRKELAEYLSVSKRTIDRAIENGMPCYRLSTGTIRFELEEVKQWMKEQEEK